MMMVKRRVTLVFETGEYKNSLLAALKKLKANMRDFRLLDFSVHELVSKTVEQPEDRTNDYNIN